METFKNRWVPPDKEDWASHQEQRSKSDEDFLKERRLTWEDVNAVDHGRADDGSFTTEFTRKWGPL